MLEKTIERRFVREGKALSAWTPKAEKMYRGFPDRICFCRPKRIAFVELKRPGEKLRPAQKIVRSILQRMGFLYVKIDTPEQVTEFYREWLG